MCICEPSLWTTNRTLHFNDSHNGSNGILRRLGIVTHLPLLKHWLVSECSTKILLILKNGDNDDDDLMMINRDDDDYNDDYVTFIKGVVVVVVVILVIPFHQVCWL